MELGRGQGYEDTCPMNTRFQMGRMKLWCEELGYVTQGDFFQSENKKTAIGDRALTE